MDFNIQFIYLQTNTPLFSSRKIPYRKKNNFRKWLFWTRLAFIYFEDIYFNNKLVPILVLII